MNEVFPERRRGTRYVTLKNAAMALGVALSIFLIWHQWRPARSSSSRELFESRVPASDPQVTHHPPVAVVEEGSFRGAESILIDAKPAPKALVPAPAAPQAIEHRVTTIAGGSEGVQLIVKTPAPAPPPSQSQR